MLSKAGDNERGELNGWLFLDYCPYSYLRQRNLLESLTASTWSGVSRKTLEAFISAENWPSGSPDLNPPYRKLWAVLKETSRRKSHNNLDSLTGSLVNAAAEIPLETERAVTAEWPERLEACVKAGGGHFE